MDDIAKAYAVLELEPGASLPDVNQAYKDLVFIWHPDRIPADNTRLRDKAQDKLKRLNEARSRLKQHLRHGADQVAGEGAGQLPFDPGGIGQRPENVEDCARAQFCAHRANMRHCGVVHRRHHDADPGLSQRSLDLVSRDHDVDAHLRQRVGRARLRR